MSHLPDFRTSTSLRAAFRDRPVLVTGHTGFTGSWMTTWLKSLGAQVIGLSLGLPTTPSMFNGCEVAINITDLRGDIRDADTVHDTMMQYRPEVVFHLAAQPLVLAGYADPLATLNTNIMGTAHVLDACRSVPSVRSCVVVSSDKCYEPSETAHLENDHFGGNDPYAASKACTEIVTNAYRNSYFSSERSFGLASARAGNVIGGGDWAADRIVPDWYRARFNGVTLQVRNPDAIRPWQHVLEPVSAYLMLGAALLVAPNEFSSGWNVGPDAKQGSLTVSQLIEILDAELDSVMPNETALLNASRHGRYENPHLELNTEKIRRVFGWESMLDIHKSAQWTADWYKTHNDTPQLSHDVTTQQIAEYEELIDTAVHQRMRASLLEAVMPGGRK